MSVAIRPSALGTSDWYLSRSRGTAFVFAALVLLLACASAGAVVVTEGDMRLVLPLAAALVVVGVWRHPLLGVYLVFGSALLFEQFEILGITPLTGQTRIFQNISSYTPTPLRLSLADLLVLLTLASWAFRRGAAEEPAPRFGPLGWAVAGYVSIFVVGTAIGVARGGAWDADVTFAELRGPLYVGVMYLLAANLIRRRAQVTFLLAEFAVIVGVKAIQAFVNYEASLSLPYSLDAVTSHEDVVFFDAAVGLAVVGVILGLRTKLLYGFLALQPLILGAELLAERRVAFVALGAVVVAIGLLALAGNPGRGFVLVALFAGAVAAYVVVFGEDSGALGQPMRAFKSVVDPAAVDVRDQRSSSWRDIENRNIEFTMQQLPLTGVGLGQQYLFREEPPRLWGFPYWRYTTHNAVLWLWLKAGPLGGLALWFLVARSVILGAAWHVRLADPWMRWVAALPVFLVLSQLVFSSVDLGLSYSRTMIVFGTVLGLAAFLGHQPLKAAAIAGWGQR